MKSVVPYPQNSRPYVYKARGRIAKPLLRLLKISPLRLSRSVRSRQNRRTRQDQLTIEVLRYRLDHPNAVVEDAGHTICSDAFKYFILNRYHQAYNELTPEQLARAAGIAVETVRVWLAQAPNPLFEATGLALPAEKAQAHVPGISTNLSGHFEKWLSVTRDFLNATGDELGWRASQIKRVLSMVVGVMIRALPKRLTYRHYSKIAALTPVTLFFTGYGAQVLKQSYQKNFLYGLAISVVLHFVALGVYWSIGDFFTNVEPSVRTVRIMMYPELENKIDEESSAAGSSETGKSRQAWTNSGRGAVPPLGILTERNTLIPLRVLPADYTTIPPGPNVPTMAADMPMVDIAGLQELANQGIPSSIPGTGTTPLLHFVPKPGKTPKIDLASVGGEAGAVLPSSRIAGIQTQLWGLGTTSDGFNPMLDASRAGYGGGAGASLGKGYSTGRSGALPYGSNAGYGTGRNPGSIADDRPSDNSGREKIILKSYGEKDWKSRDLKKLFHELSAWMRENSYEFSPTLKRYMRFKLGDVTSRVSIMMENDNYDLFMLCNDASEDFGLLLVAMGDSTQAICLRDAGFRKQSYYLSKGIAGRNQDNEVESVSMLEAKPTLQETSKFYSVFLSWWDKTKTGGQKKS